MKSATLTVCPPFLLAPTAADRRRAAARGDTDVTGTDRRATAGLFARLERETNTTRRPETLVFVSLGLAALGWPAWECLRAAVGF